MKAGEGLHAYLAVGEFGALGVCDDALRYARIVEKTLTGPRWS